MTVRMAPEKTASADILVVDDEPLNLRLLVDLLRPQGYRVRAASDGVQALTAARLEPPDLILLDVRMPQLSGYEVCEQLQQDEALRAIPVIFLSAAKTVRDKVRAFAAGGVDYITKPFQDKEVLVRVKAQLTVARLQDELAQNNAKLQQTNAALERRLDEQSALNLIAQTLATVTNLPKALEIVAGTLTRLFDLCGNCVVLLNTDRTKLTVYAGFVRTGSTAPEGQPSDPELIRTTDLTFSITNDPISRQVIEDGQTLVVLQAQTVPLLAPVHEILQAHNIQTLMLVPLVASGKTTGLMALATDQPERDFTQEEMSLAKTIAVQIAGAIETARLFEEERRQRQLAESLRNVAAKLNSSLQQPAVLAAVFEQLGRMLPYDSAALFLPVDETLVLSHGAGLAKGMIGLELPLTGADPIVRVFQEKRPLFFAGIERMPLAKVRKEGLASGSWLAAPLLVDYETIGVLTVERCDLCPYREDDQYILQAFTSHAALAIKNARFHEETQVAATAKERNRMARELHDSITQALYSMTLHIDATRLALWSNKLEIVENHLDSLKQMARDAMAEMRLLIFEMRPPTLVEVGLAEALKARLEMVEARSGIKIDLEVDGERRLPPETQAELYRVALEGLNNVLKHAEAEHAAVRLLFRDSCLRMTIQDDGLGFDPESAARYGGYGLATMKERLQQIGGIIAVHTAPGAGTTLEIEVDL